MSTNVSRTGEFAAFLIAPLVPATVVGIIAWSFEAAGAPYFVAAYHLVIAVPVYLGMKARHQPGLRACAIAGLLIGALPIGLLSFKALAIHPAASLAAVAFGLLGALSGALFWAVIQISSESSSRTSQALLAGAIIATIALFALASDEGDATCHDITEEVQSRSSVLHIDADIPSSDWGRLLLRIRRFAAEREMLDFREDSTLGRGWPRAFSVSMCTDKGVRIGIVEYQHFKAEASDDRGVGIAFYVLDPAYDWKSLAHELIDDIEKEWPDSVRFRDRGGRIVPVEETKLKTKYTDDRHPL